MCPFRPPIPINYVFLSPAVFPIATAVSCFNTAFQKPCMSITDLKVKSLIPFQYIPIRHPAWYKLQFLLLVENRRLHNKAEHVRYS